ncbi:unnamed protein product [Didymodactylos carnosus]|uniref:Uncharacterized protein n=1 Tax=Didymodactylos carnosus TaxID=1234261 RepID=A0A815VBM5_9BILA|nr:unnamed protein product [Didymodactylos carnosus]CAF4389151.1 unnamed protein product [Didymodactylos carnosus]
MDFFQQSGTDVNKALFEQLLTKDTKCLSKPQNTTEQRQKQIQRKAVDRKRSMKPQMDIQGYDAGGFNL